MPVNLNFDGTALVKWAARPLVCRTESHAKEVKRRKLIEMAKECASNVKIADWDVVVWPPADVTSGIVDILASTKQCRTAHGCTQVAWELSGIEHVSSPILTQITKCFTSKSGTRPRVFVSNFDSHKFQKESLKFTKFLKQIVMKWGVVDSIQILRAAKTEIENKGPLWTWNSCYERSYSIPKWSSQLIQEYVVLWDEITCKLEDGALEPPGSSSPEIKKDVFTKTLLNTMDIVVTRKFGKKYGLSTFTTSEIPYPPPLPRSKDFLNFFEGKAIAPPVHFAGRISTRFVCLILTLEYVSFLSSRLRRHSGVGRFTNKITLRNKHVFNKLISAQDHRMWAAFEAHLADKREGIPSCSVIPVEPTEDIDHLESMCQVLGGHVHDMLNLQVSIVDKCVEKCTEYDRESFLSKISRRHVRLLKNGEDRALVIPYLGKILLKLSNPQWVQANDVKALQPLALDKELVSSEAIRRAANILLALDSPDSGKPVVNDIALEVVKQYARKGELYSMEMRDELLAIVQMKSRVCIRALQTSARDVFGKDETTMVSTLVREMIHDRLHMRSGFGLERVNFRNGTNELVIHENDAYYDSAYLRRQCGVENNVLWGPGVSVLGTRAYELRGSGADCKYFSSGRRIRPMAIALRITKDYRQTWVAEKYSDDVDEASASVANPDSSEHIDLYPKSIFRLFQLGKRDIKIGKYWSALIKAEKNIKTSGDKKLSDEKAG